MSLVRVITALLAFATCAPFVASVPAKKSTATTTSTPTPKPYVNPFFANSNWAAVQYSLEQVWFNNRRAWCYNFTDNGRNVWPSKIGNDSSAIISPVLVPFYANGTNAGYPIFQTIPTDQYYSDAVSMIKVIVPYNFTQDSIRIYERMAQKGFPLYPSGYYNWPIVTRGSKFVQPSVGGKKPVPLRRPIPKKAWFGNKAVYYFNLGLIPVDPASGSVVTGTFYNVTDSNGDPLGNPVIDVLPNLSPGYSGFFAVKTVTCDKPADSIRRADVITSSVDTNTIINCPVVAWDNATYTGPVPGPQPPIKALPNVTWVGGANIYTNGPGVAISPLQGYYKNQSILCWNFGTNSAPYVDDTGKPQSDQSNVLVNSVLFPSYKNGSSAGKPVFQGLPVDGRYSDAVLAWNVQVPDSCQFDQYTDYASLSALGLGSINGVYNFPIVPYGSYLKFTAAYNASSARLTPPGLRLGWWNGNDINFFDNGIACAYSGHGSVPTSTAVLAKSGTIFADINVANDAGYSGFYSYGKCTGTETYKDSSYFTANNIQYNLGILNCPTAAFI